MTNESEIIEELNEEDKELKRALIPFEKYPKLKRWVQLFTDQSNKATYGNRTESAVQAGYNCQTRADFANIGAQNYRKLYGLASIFVEDAGISVKKIMETITARALTSENPKWIELLTELTNIRDPKGSPQIMIQNNIQNHVEVSEQDKIDFNQKFKEWIKNS